TRSGGCCARRATRAPWPGTSSAWWTTPRWPAAWAPRAGPMWNATTAWRTAWPCSRTCCNAWRGPEPATNRTMRVTVLITLYNKGPYLEEAVRSVLDGTYQDLEVLVVDDGSTDDGPERVRRIGDPRVRLLTSERNRGRPFAANRGYDE